MEVAAISQINTTRTKSTYDQKVMLVETGFTENLHLIGSCKMLGQTCSCQPRSWIWYTAKNTKRKTWKSSSTSCTEESFLPHDKRIKHNTSLTDSEPSSKSDEVVTMLNMVEMVNPKLDQVLEKLHKLEHQIQSVDEKVNSLQAKIEYFKAFKKETETKIKEFEVRLNFANAERKLFQRNFKKKFQKEKKVFQDVSGGQI